MSRVGLCDSRDSRHGLIGDSVGCQKQRECHAVMVAVRDRVSTIGTRTEVSNPDVSNLPVIPFLKVYTA